MHDVTQILQLIKQGDSAAADQLLPMVYDELRKLAAAKLAQEKPGQTLQATALVHEAYIRLVGCDVGDWNNSEHFFRVAAEAMRRILVESARRKNRQKRGGELIRVELLESDVITHVSPEQLLSVNETLGRLADEDPQAAEIVKLRYFAGFSTDEAAQILKISRATAYRHWTFARAWIRVELLSDESNSSIG